MKIVNTLQGTKLRDKLVSYAALFVIMILSITLAGSIKRSRVVKEEIEAKRDNLAKIERETAELQNNIIKVQSEEYIEKEIRNKLGLVKNGEVIVVLPDIETLKKLEPEAEVDNQTLPDPNWKKWLKLFM